VEYQKTHPLPVDVIEPQTTDERINKLKFINGPSMLLDAAASYLDPSAIASSSTTDSTTDSAAQMESLQDEPEDDVDLQSDKALPHAPSTSSIEDFFESNVEMVEPAELDIDDIDAPTMRAAYARMLMSIGGSGPTPCPVCQTDCTAMEAMRIRKWATSWLLNRHVKEYHNLFAQVNRYWVSGDGVDPDTMHTCFLCASDGEPAIRFEPRKSLSRHLHDGPVHAQDPRMQDESWKVVASRVTISIGNVSEVEMSMEGVTLHTPEVLDVDMEVDEDLMIQTMVAVEGTGVTVNDALLARGVARRLRIEQH